MKLSRHAALWVGGVTPLAALMILLSFLFFKQSEEAAARQRHTAQVLGVAEAFMSGLKDAETGQRGYLLTGEEAYLEPYQAVRHQLAGQLAQLRQLTQEDAAQQRRLEILLPLVDEKLAWLQQSITLRRDKSTEEALKMARSGQDEKLMDAIRGVMGEFIALERGAQAKDEPAFDLTLHHLKLLIVAVSSFIGVLSLFSAFVVYRETSGRLQVREQADRAIRDAREDLKAREEELAARVIAHESKHDALLVRQDELSSRLSTHASENAALMEREKALTASLEDLERERASIMEREASLSASADEVARERVSLVAREEALSMRLGELDQVRASLNAREDGLSVRLKEHESARASLQDREKALSEKNKGLEQERAAFRSREATLSAALDLIGEAVLCVDVVGTVTYMNSCAERLTGWRRNEAGGRPVADVVRIVDRKSAEAPASLSSLQDGAVLLLARDGTECLVTERRSGLGNAEGESAGMVWILHDVTQEYAAYQALHQAVPVEPDRAMPVAAKDLASLFAAMESAAQDRDMTGSAAVSEVEDIFRRLERH